MRRGGEGAVLNSKGEFNRSYIPRLRVEEEEPTEAREARIKEKEQLNVILEEQDSAWEKEKVKKLGADAIMGPTTSPKKRSQGSLEDNQGAPSKRRKKRRKHEVLGEGWGEQEQTHSPGEQEGQEVTILEQTSIQESIVPEEQGLRQLPITGFLNPAATPEKRGDSPRGRPTLQNAAASQHVVVSTTATRRSSCGSPSKVASAADLRDEEVDPCFVDRRENMEGGSNMKNIENIGIKNNTQKLENDIKNIESGKLEDNFNYKKTEKSKSTLLPSIGGEKQTGRMKTGNTENIGGGSPMGAVLFHTKAPSADIQEGDPPLGKERGTLGVGTGPTPPPGPTSGM